MATEKDEAVDRPTGRSIDEQSDIIRDGTFDTIRYVIEPSKYGGLIVVRVGFYTPFCHRRCTQSDVVHTNPIFRVVSRTIADTAHAFRTFDLDGDTDQFLYTLAANSYPLSTRFDGNGDQGSSMVSVVHQKDLSFLVSNADYDVMVQIFEFFAARLELAFIENFGFFDELDILALTQGLWVSKRLHDDSDLETVLKAVDGLTRCSGVLPRDSISIGPTQTRFNASFTNFRAP